MIRISGVRLLIGIATALQLSFVSHAIADGPSIADTLKWMESTYNDHYSEGGSMGHGRWGPFADSELTKSSRQGFTYDGCIITLNFVNITKRWAKNNKLRFVPVKESWVVNLADIDPNSVKLNFFSSNYGDHAKIMCDESIGVCNLAELGFETTNQEPKINVTDQSALGDDLGVYDKTENKTFNYGYFIFDDIPYSRRFQNAFQHLVGLCGGKPSPF